VPGDPDSVEGWRGPPKARSEVPAFSASSAGVTGPAPGVPSQAASAWRRIADVNPPGPGYTLTRHGEVVMPEDVATNVIVAMAAGGS
jgi:hypothetical protein